MKKLIMILPLAATIMMSGCRDRRAELKTSLRDAMQYFGYSSEEIAAGSEAEDKAVDELDKVFIEDADMASSFKSAFERVKAQTYSDEEKKFVMEVGRQIFKPGVKYHELPLDFLDSQRDVLAARIYLLKKMIPGYNSIFDQQKETNALRQKCLNLNAAIASKIGFKYWNDEAIRQKGKIRLTEIESDMLAAQGLLDGIDIDANSISRSSSPLQVKNGIKEILDQYIGHPKERGKVLPVARMSLKQLADGLK